MFNKFVEGPVASWRDKVWAKRAFNLRYPECGRSYPRHFRDGFIQGYCDACDGGDVKPPTLPPEKYWSPRYQSEQGTQMIDAWFTGYPEGAIAAREDGAGRSNDVRISDELVQSMREAKDPRFLQPTDKSYREYMSDGSTVTPAAVPLDQGEEQNVEEQEFSAPVGTQFPPGSTPGEIQPASSPRSSSMPLETPTEWPRKLLRDQPDPRGAR